MRDKFVRFSVLGGLVRLKVGGAVSGRLRFERMTLLPLVVQGREGWQYTGLSHQERC